MSEVAVLNGYAHLTGKPAVCAAALMAGVFLALPHGIEERMAHHFALAHRLVRQQTKGFPRPGNVGADIGPAVEAEVAVAAPVLSAVIDRGVAGIDDLPAADVSDFRLCVDHFMLLSLMCVRNSAISAYHPGCGGSDHPHRTDARPDKHVAGNQERPGRLLSSGDGLEPDAVLTGGYFYKRSVIQGDIPPVQ